MFSLAFAYVQVGDCKEKTMGKQQEEAGSRKNRKKWKIKKKLKTKN